MLISSHTSRFDTKHKLSPFEIVKLFADAGFEGYNLNMNLLIKDENYIFCQDDYREQAQKLKEYADSLGIRACATHSPYPTSFNDPDRTEQAFEMLKRSIEITSIIGATHTVIHPNQHLTYREHKEELKDINIDFYKRLKPHAEKFGVKIAIENMWQWRHNFKNEIITDSVCSSADEFCEYVDMFPREHFCACLDIGHIPLVGEDLEYIIRKLGDRIEVIHLHDNDFKADRHHLPFLGKIDFKNVLDLLYEVGYKGDLNLEINGYVTCFPTELLPSATKFSYDVAKYLKDNSKF